MGDVKLEVYTYTDPRVARHPDDAKQDLEVLARRVKDVLNHEPFLNWTISLSLGSTRPDNHQISYQTHWDLSWNDDYARWATNAALLGPLLHLPWRARLRFAWLLLRGKRLDKMEVKRGRV